MLSKLRAPADTFCNDSCGEAPFYTPWRRAGDEGKTSASEGTLKQRFTNLQFHTLHNE
jgi:hypothetical protein